MGGRERGRREGRRGKGKREGEGRREGEGKVGGRVRGRREGERDSKLNVYTVTGILCSSILSCTVKLKCHEFLKNLNYIVNNQGMLILSSVLRISIICCSEAH